VRVGRGAFQATPPARHRITMLRPLIRAAAKLKGKLENSRAEQRWARLQQLGMHIGRGVNLPASTWIDTSHCFLISIGDWSGFGEQCMILAHDGQMDEFLDAGRIGRVIIHPHSHIGARTVVLAGVEIGPRTIVGANSVVTKSLPPDTVCAGNPAKVICSLEEYLERHRERMRERPTFSYAEYDIRTASPARKREMIEAVADGDAYVVGGHTALLQGSAGMMTTPISSEHDRD
jgi:maltose O-acetyltransferase